MAPGRDESRPYRVVASMFKNGILNPRLNSLPARATPAPIAPGHSIEMKPASLDDDEHPQGKAYRS